MSVRVLTPESMLEADWTDERRSSVFAWLIEHGLDPFLVFEVRVDGKDATVSSYVPGPTGGPQYDLLTKAPKSAVAEFTVKRPLP